MALLYFYNSNAGENDSKVVDKNWVAYYGGIDPSVSTPGQLAAAGFYKFTNSQPPAFNPLIYTLESSFVIEGNDATLAYAVQLLPLTDSKTTYEQAVSSKAYSLLQPTDWVVVRQSETGVEALPETITWRESIRTAAESKTDAIQGCESPESLDTYVNSEEYSHWPPSP